MPQATFMVDGIEIPCITCRVVVVGSGAAALNAAVHLRRFGVDDILIVTEGLGKGTSANAGSDKQTYYRLNPGGPHGDSVMAMAQDLFAGGCMHGDVALAEAALSSREFYHLLELGVDFPHDRYGRYPGYKTDHDSKSRGTSAGPRTSILMYACLISEVRRLQIPIMDHTMVIDILTQSENDAKKVAGLIVLDEESISDPSLGFKLIHAQWVVYATGGPGGLYSDSVYPESQIGSLGIAFQAGACGQNLTQCQFGIASKNPRWNLSGSYQQVLPRYISTNPDGGNENEFLAEYFTSLEKLIYAQFLKGYQWPFDIRKVDAYGSSAIDLLVYYETRVKGRRVFLDFTRNINFPGSDFSLKKLPGVVREYLQNSGALSETPVQRLKDMNLPAYELFYSKGVDLACEPLEIAVSYQHLNGGLKGSIWWESNINNFFPVGEVCGTHGIYRPGGSALNSGQVGSLRASQMIAARIREQAGVSKKGIQQAHIRIMQQKLKQFREIFGRTEKIDPVSERIQIQERMSNTLGIIRNAADIAKALQENERMREAHKIAGVSDAGHLVSFVRNEDLLVTEQIFLEANRAVIERIERGRGSFLVGRIDDIFKLNDSGEVQEIEVRECEQRFNTEILEISMSGTGDILKRFVQTSPIPKDDIWFEKVWAAYRRGEIFR